MKRMMLVALAMLLVIPAIPFAGNSNIETVRADGTTTFVKSVDTDNNGIFNDEGQIVLTDHQT